jgi:sugar-phosphatase
MAEPLEHLRREYAASVESAYAAVEPADGARDLVDAADAWGVPLVLVTSAPRRLAVSFVVRAGLADSFAAIVSGEDGPPKPDPGLFRVALERVEVQPLAALAVEDSPAGVRAARAAAVPVVGVSAEPERAAALREAGAGAVVSDLRPLAAALNSVGLRPDS